MKFICLFRILFARNVLCAHKAETMCDHIWHSFCEWRVNLSTFFRRGWTKKRMRKSLRRVYKSLNAKWAVSKQKRRCHTQLQLRWNYFGKRNENISHFEDDEAIKVIAFERQTFHSFLSLSFFDAGKMAWNRPIFQWFSNLKFETSKIVLHLAVNSVQKFLSVWNETKQTKSNIHFYLCALIPLLSLSFSRSYIQYYHSRFSFSIFFLLRKHSPLQSIENQQQKNDPEKKTNRIETCTFYRQLTVDNISECNLSSQFICAAYNCQHAQTMENNSNNGKNKIQKKEKKKWKLEKKNCRKTSRSISPNLNWEQKGTNSWNRNEYEKFEYF